MMDHGKMDMSQASASMTDGEIKKVDQSTGKVTKHGEIKHMEMPGNDHGVHRKRQESAGAKPGDKVKFMVVNEGGKMAVTRHSACSVRTRCSGVLCRRGPYGLNADCDGFLQEGEHYVKIRHTLVWYLSAVTSLSGDDGTNRR